MDLLNLRNAVAAEEEAELMARVDAQKTETVEMCYIIEEDEPGGPEDEKMHTVFIGTHDQLNLYLIWYNRENKLIVPAEVIDSFVPLVRVLKGEEECETSSLPSAENSLKS